MEGMHESDVEQGDTTPAEDFLFSKIWLGVSHADANARRGSQVWVVARVTQYAYHVLGMSLSELDLSVAFGDLWVCYTFNGDLLQLDGTFAPFSYGA